MINISGFKGWLETKTQYSKETVRNILSRVKRADQILPWFNEEAYVYYLEQTVAFQNLSCSVKSQIKKAVKYYFDYISFENAVSSDNNPNTRNKALSLFANIGVAEAYLESIGVNVVIANEFIERRANLYSKIYPNCHMICGDITDSLVFEQIVSESISKEIDIIIATPPCQGMSTAGQQAADDFRNTLICPVISAIKRIQPKYVFLENVPMFLNTSIYVDGEYILIPDLLDRELSNEYNIRKYVIDTADYSVPQTRDRAIILMTRKNCGLREWLLPPKDLVRVTMKDAIGSIPSIDPYVTDISDDERRKLFPEYEEKKKRALAISHWNMPPEHIYRQVIAMMHTPTGCTAFDNKKYYPKKEDGTPVKGYHNTYKRQNWDTAAYTVTMDNRKISSQNNVHPGRYLGKDENGDDIYSDARTLTLYEIMRIMSLPEDWPVPVNTSEAFLRRIIGEGIPPLFVKKVFQNINKE